MNLPRSFRNRFTLLLNIFILILFIIGITLAYNVQKQVIKDEIINITKLKHTVLEKSLSEAIIYEDIYTIYQVTETILSNSELYSNVYIFEKKDVFIIDGKGTKSYPESFIGERFYVMDLKLSNNIVGKIVFEINERFIGNKLHNSLKLLILVHIIAYILVVLMLRRFIVALLRPFSKLVDVLENVNSLENIDEKITIQSNDPKEIVKLKSVLVALAENLKKQLQMNVEKEKEILKKDKVASLGMMAAGLAHHPKNPIMTIKLLIDTLKDEIKSNEGEKDVEVIKTELQKMLNVINEFMNLYKSDNIIIVNVKLVDILDKLYQNFKYHEKLNLIFSRDETIIKTDSNKILLIFENLVLNSIEAGAKNVYINVVKLVNKLHIEVIDDGSGIDKDKIDKIFLPFFTTKVYGTGLGLTYVQNLAHLLNMDIFIDKEYGNGAKFVLVYKYEEKNINN
ncbi:MAG: HAMP domain-containing histidine kinase [Deferribacterales bacterium]